MPYNVPEWLQALSQTPGASTPTPTGTVPGSYATTDPQGAQALAEALGAQVFTGPAGGGPASTQYPGGTMLQLPSGQTLAVSDAAAQLARFQQEYQRGLSNLEMNLNQNPNLFTGGYDYTVPIDPLVALQQYYAGGPKTVGRPSSESYRVPTGLGPVPGGTGRTQNPTNVMPGGTPSPRANQGTNTPGRTASGATNSTLNLAGTPSSSTSGSRSASSPSAGSRGDLGNLLALAGYLASQGGGGGMPTASFAPVVGAQSQPIQSYFGKFFGR